MDDEPRPRASFRKISMHIDAEIANVGLFRCRF
jgi:hypothetical protein